MRYVFITILAVIIISTAATQLDLLEHRTEEKTTLQAEEQKNELALAEPKEKKQTVVLNMIIKNETDVIQRCLGTVKPLIDYWVIEDTGSTDGTQAMVKEFMKDIPGELHERPWVNFAHNRNEAMALAKDKADYILFIDADEQYIYPKEFSWPKLDKDFYFLMTEFSGTNYGRVQLINSKLDWQWKGVLHEGLYSTQARTAETMPGITLLVSTDGSRSKDPLKYQKDVEVLEKALVDDPHNTRYQFYLAQSHKDAGNYEAAVKNYQKRISMGGFDQEVFWSKLQLALMQELLKMPAEVVENSYMQAYNYRPTRAEPLYRIAYYHRRAENYLAGYKAARKGLHLTQPADVLFVEHWIYDYGLLMEYSVCAYWIGKYHEALLASLLILKNPTLPENIRTCVEKNLEWIYSKIEKPKINTLVQGPPLL